ncbi:hypothetical protein K492DRAFT_116547, partial [Lichtheimia hyalospora FSU 10163]
IPVFVFLTEICNNIKMPGPYIMIEKGLLLLQYLLMDINPESFYYETDCIAFDGLYENSINEYIEKYKNIGHNISLRNFCYPVKKDKNIKLREDEEHFNGMLSGFRSKIETYFAELGNIFQRFNGKMKIRITDKKIYNLQLKLAVVLLNIKYFQELFPISNVNHYGKWRITNFEYTFKDKK